MKNILLFGILVILAIGAYFIFVKKAAAQIVPPGKDAVKPPEKFTDPNPKSNTRAVVVMGAHINKPVTASNAGSMANFSRN